ncbi:MAG: threonine/homoserine/homoserine lactone efflux protein, partial [Paraglaciecola sp.]
CAGKYCLSIFAANTKGITMELTTWLSLVAVCILGALSPGPSLAVILRLSLTQSAKHGAVAALTHGFGVGLWALLTMQGLAVVMTAYPELFNAISIAGGLYLAWIGIKAIRYAGKNALPESKLANMSLGQAAWDGLMISMLNPKLALFFLALFSQFIHTDMDLSTQTLLWATVLLIDSGWYLLVAFLLAGGPLLRWLRQHIKWVDRGMGSLLIGLGLRVVVG